MPASAVAQASSFEVRVMGPHCDPLCEADLRRLFPGSVLTDQRLDRLREWPRMLVSSGATVVGAATCRRVEDELLVPDIGLADDAPGASGEVLDPLLDALEAACLAGGSHRLVLSPPRWSLGLLERRGYHAIDASCAGCWVQKTI